MANAPSQVDIRKVVLLSASGRSVDVTYIFDTITIRESMMMPAVNGSIVIEDDHDHFEILPIIGQEELRIELEAFDENYVFTFRVYKLSDIEKVTARTTRYTLYFTSREMLTNEKNRVSRSYSNQPYSSMVHDILAVDIQTSKRIAIAETENTATHVVPNLRPYNAINQILRKSVAAINGSSNYVFFEDRRGFIAAPLNSFVTQQTKYTYHYTENVGPEGLNDYIMDPFGIIKLDMKKQSDVLDLTSRGFFASQLHSIDILQRKIDVYDYDYFEIFDETKHLNRNLLFFPEEQFNVEGQQYFTYSTETALDNAYVADNYSDMVPDVSSQFRARRLIQNLMFTNYVINMSIIGNPTLFVGDVIDIDILSNASKSDERQHKTMSGRTMISALSHVFGPNRSYMQRIEAVKDSLAEDLGEGL